VDGANKINFLIFNGEGDVKFPSPRTI